MEVERVLDDGIFTTLRISRSVSYYCLIHVTLCECTLSFPLSLSLSFSLFQYLGVAVARPLVTHSIGFVLLRVFPFLVWLWMKETCAMTRWLALMMNSLFYIVDVLCTRILSKYEFIVYFRSGTRMRSASNKLTTLYTLKLPRVFECFSASVNMKHARFFFSFCFWNEIFLCFVSNIATTQNTCATRILCLCSQLMKQLRSFKLIIFLCPTMWSAIFVFVFLSFFLFP